MEGKQRVVEMLYKALNVVILSENAENIRAVTLSKKQGEWELIMTTAYETPLDKSPELSRKFYKDVRFKATKKSQ